MMPVVEFYRLCDSIDLFLDCILSPESIINDHFFEMLPDSKLKEPYCINCDEQNIDWGDYWRICPKCQATCTLVDTADLEFLIKAAQYSIDSWESDFASGYDEGLIEYKKRLEEIKAKYLTAHKES